uniref:Ig-like domain-containing protein n=1 Tax=Amphiprion percula TaxID=161767 RepID=A0A3P8S1L8_AMPPE
MALSLALTATQEGLRVRQHPPSLSVMRGETATLSCHFKVESLKYGVQWFKMKSGKQLIAKSSRHIALEKNQTSSLVITDVAPEDSGWYYCEVNVLHKDPEWGNGTELVVLGEKQIAGFRNEHDRSSLGFAVLGCSAHKMMFQQGDFHIYLILRASTPHPTLSICRKLPELLLNAQNNLFVLFVLHWIYRKLPLK